MSGWIVVVDTPSHHGPGEAKIPFAVAFQNATHAENFVRDHAPTTPDQVVTAQAPLKLSTLKALGLLPGHMLPL
jgi:hypothetical protein